MDFIDFLYRQHAADRWRRWAEAVWNRDYYRSMKGKDEKEAQDNNPFAILVQAFQDAQLGVLKARAPDLTKLKQVLAKAEDAMFPHGISREDHELLDYPLRS
jgi:hypothetical protein